MPSPFKQVEVTDTRMFTWTGSSAPSSLWLAIKTASGTIVNSVSAVQSTGGQWYAFVTIPDSFGSYPAYLLAEWTAVASTHVGTATQFVSRMLFQVIKTAAFAHAGS